MNFLILVLMQASKNQVAILQQIAAVKARGDAQGDVMVRTYPSELVGAK